MKFAQLLDLVRTDGGLPASRFADDLALITTVSLDLAETELASSDPALLAASYEENRPTAVTVVVLSRDEEDRIAGTLGALVHDTDHCLLIDSGSTDATVRRAREARADVRVLNAAWVDDFAHHRNLAFGHVTEGWILHVDADEVLATGHAGRIRRALGVLDHVLPEADFVVSPTIADIDGPTYTNTQRALRSGSALRFRGRVHEHPYDASGNSPARIGIDARLDHAGYLPEVVEARGKRDRYGRLCRLAAAEEPGHPKWVFYEVRDTLDYRTTSRQDLMAAFARLEKAFEGSEPGVGPDYRSERTIDAWALLCELAVRFGGAEEIRAYSALLAGAGRPVEATYYRTVLESSRLLGRLSALVDGISAVEPHEEPGNRHLMARLFELQATLALSSGRYEAVEPAYGKAVARGAGQSVTEDFAMLGRLLPGPRSGTGQ
ncbi:glycosyltransferase [Streptomyces sp. NBC_01281]|uniref:glycosyltransferase n=1 Tax=Streptomyces sp. NBC_01281 TaxID=2903811 RepID=UPI002E0E21CE|nr:glycosyltransferase [Streptomyces sp. NBC_01281]